MSAWAEYLKFFAGLVAILNPIGVIPIFINLTQNQTTAERNRTAFNAAVTVAVVLVVALLAGEFILRFFGISVASFQVGGGILILLNSLSMLQAKVGPTRQTEEEAQETQEKEQVAVVPLGVPLTAGPGAISTVILYGHRPALFGRYVVLVMGIIIISCIVWAAFRLAPLISRALSRTGINIVTRLMGLIMVAIGVEFIAGGLRVLFPAIGG
ncbi:MAG TPA: YchE family NAAT transporter [Gammaproteobacteria bacterium]|jgi:multiple antibiotic resistance protein|nr:YchE family NAAT transporter [Gammaproteobacteria bacterium]